MLHVDKNKDGVIAVSSETIVWRLDKEILRRDTGGGGQPVINGVRAQPAPLMWGEATTDEMCLNYLYFTQP